MNRLHVYIRFGIGIESIRSSSQQQRYTITIYSTTHESNPMHSDTAFYILYHQKQQEHEYKEKKNEYNYYKEEENYNH